MESIVIDNSNIFRLKQRMRVQIIAGVIIVVFLASGVWIWRTVTLKTELAIMLTRSVERDLQFGDLRGSIINLDRAGGSLFGEIRYFDGDNEPKFVVRQNPVAYAPFSIQMKVKSPESDSANAVLDFRFNPLAGLDYFLLAVAPILSGLGLFEFRRSMKRLSQEVKSFGLLKAAEATESLAIQVSHDIRSPLSAINMIVKSLPEIPEEKRALIQGAADRINGIANDLLCRYKGSGLVGASQVQVLGKASSPALQLRPAVISEILRDIGAEKTAILSDHPDVQFRLDVAGPLEAICMVDEKELARAISNLVNNSVEALDDSGAGVVTLALRSAGPKEIAIIVSDNGKGIPEEILVKLGKERVSSGKEGTESGAGIGILHAVYAVEGMGGHFSIQSKIGMGTIITMRFARTDTGSMTSTGPAS